MATPEEERWRRKVALGLAPEASEPTAQPFHWGPLEPYFRWARAKAGDVDYNPPELADFSGSRNEQQSRYGSGAAQANRDWSTIGLSQAMRRARNMYQTSPPVRSSMPMHGLSGPPTDLSRFDEPLVPGPSGNWTPALTSADIDPNATGGGGGGPRSALSMVTGAAQPASGWPMAVENEEIAAKLAAAQARLDSLNRAEIDAARQMANRPAYETDPRYTRRLEEVMAATDRTRQLPEYRDPGESNTAGAAFGFATGAGLGQEVRQHRQDRNEQSRYEYKALVQSALRYEQSALRAAEAARSLDAAGRTDEAEKMKRLERQYTLRALEATKQSEDIQRLESQRYNIDGINVGAKEAIPWNQTGRIQNAMDRRFYDGLELEAMRTLNSIMGEGAGSGGAGGAGGDPVLNRKMFDVVMESGPKWLAMEAMKPNADPSLKLLYEEGMREAQQSEGLMRDARALEDWIGRYLWTNLPEKRRVKVLYPHLQRAILAEQLTSRGSGALGGAAALGLPLERTTGGTTPR